MLVRTYLALPLVAAFVAAASAAPMVQQIDLAPSVEQVADGCGAARYRGPGGACHLYGRGPYPGGYYGRYMWGATSCPPGYWRGPWGHCRDTPYHGRLPGGGWKP
jgi:hypothetical protein